MEVIGLKAPERRRRNRSAMMAAILETAIGVMRESGTTQLSLHEVGRRIGMRAQSLYKYFPSKGALLDALFAEGARRLLESDRRVWQQTPADWSRIETWLASRLAFAREQGPLYELTISPSAFPFECSAEGQAIAESVGERAVEAMRELVDSGALAAHVSPRRATNVLLAAARGIVGETLGKELFFSDTGRLMELMPDFVAVFRYGWGAGAQCTGGETREPLPRAAGD